MNPFLRKSHAFLRAPRSNPTALPDFTGGEIGLMTREEFLKSRNRRGVQHPGTAYDLGLAELNPVYVGIGIANRTERWKTHTFQLNVPYGGGGGEGYIIERDDVPVAVLHQGTLYHSSGVAPDEIPRTFRHGSDDIKLQVQQAKRVKYVAEYIPLVSDVAARNRKTHNHVLQNLTVNGEVIRVCSEGVPRKNKGTAMAALNPKGQVVAIAQDEWRATLIVVAREYRGSGLGTFMSKLWHQYNPAYDSGGFTPKGEASALREWEDRVRTFLAHGWYTAFVRQGKMSQTRVKQIVSGLRGRGTSPLPEAKASSRQKGEVLVYTDDFAFVVYDSRFLDEQDEKYIYGFGFFRGAEPVGKFLFRIDYDRPYHKLATMVAMQMARDENEKVYVGPGYADMLELEGVTDVRREGDYAFLTKDVLPLKTFAAYERRVRRPKDPYNEKLNLLMELAEAKW